MLFTRLMQIQLLHQCLTCDHFSKLPEKTVVSHLLLQACRTPRATQERLQHKVWLTALHQKFSRQQGLSTPVKVFHDLWGRANHPSTESAPSDVALGGRAGFQGAMGGGWVFLQNQCSFATCTCAKPVNTLQKC